MFFFMTLLSLAVFYTIISIILIIGVSRIKRNTTRSSGLPYVSILVPAKDEENFIGKCLESLVHQKYPPDKYKIVVVNDRSTDNTPAIIDDYRKRYEIVKSVNIDINSSGLTGKQNAQNEGLKLCAGEIILSIDADCVAGDLWVHSIVSCFTPEIGLVAGVTTVNCSDKSLFARLQALDMLFLMDSGAGAIGLNVPFSCIGNNMAYRSAIIGELGSLRMKYAITEDSDLLHKVAQNTKWGITTAYNKDAVVLTFAEKNLRRFLNQRIRWVLGGQANISLSLISLYIIFLFNICLLIAFPLVFFVQKAIYFALLSILIKLAIDFVRCWRVCKEFDRTDLLLLFAPYEAFMLFYSIIVGLGSMFIKKIRWKDDVYRR